ncbi:cobalamin biosynthesis protein [Rhodovulum sp. DZ06]|uniref:cobalamin biosynthesis protein n=1 Tax=Rhodovulum sp. DZ06 TaxID=3425126 RepID=UPI003D327234
MMIVAGFGFREGASPAALRAALDAAMAGAPGQSGAAPWMLAAPADKAQGPAFEALADTLGLPAAPIPQDALAAADPACLTRSAASEAARGVGSVAEASALAALGPGARLLAPRAVSPCGMATCALALMEGPTP